MPALHRCRSFDAEGFLYNAYAKDKVMERKRWRWVSTAGCAGLIMFGGWVGAQEAPPSPGGDDAASSSAASSAAIRKRLQEQSERIDAMRNQIDAQATQLDAMRKELAQQEVDYKSLRQAVGMGELDQQRGGNLNIDGTSASTLPMQAAAQAGPATAAETPQVGQAPPTDTRPPAVAPIFDQPGVLTPKHKLVIEPSYQFGYSSADYSRHPDWLDRRKVGADDHADCRSHGALRHHQSFGSGVAYTVCVDGE